METIVRRAYAVTLVLWLSTSPALADEVINAKVECQAEYGSGSDLDIACERGVDLAARAPDEAGAAMAACDRDGTDPKRAASCRRGVALHTRRLTQKGGDRSSSFSYSWEQGRGGVQVDVGDYQLKLGDTERSMEDCMRSFEGSSTPPSCLSGIQVQPQPPGPPPQRSLTR